MQDISNCFLPNNNDPVYSLASGILAYSLRVDGSVLSGTKMITTPGLAIAVNGGVISCPITDQNGTKTKTDITITFNENLRADVAAIYRLFFLTGFGTASAITVNDAAGLPIAGNINGNSSLSFTIKALSVAGPYSWAIANGTKQIEIRSWYTSYTGPALLHASSGAGYEHMFDHFKLERKYCPKFAIIGAAKIKTCIQYNLPKLWDSHKSRHCWDETYEEVLEQYGKFPFGHVMVDPIIFDEPILNIKGALNYWAPRTDDQKAGFERAIAQLKSIAYC